MSSAEEQQENLLLAFSASLNVQLSVRGSSDFFTSGTVREALLGVATATAQGWRKIQ